MTFLESTKFLKYDSSKNMSALWTGVAISWDRLDCAASTDMTSPDRKCQWTALVQKNLKAVHALAAWQWLLLFTYSLHLSFKVSQNVYSWSEFQWYAKKSVQFARFAKQQKQRLHILLQIGKVLFFRLDNWSPYKPISKDYMHLQTITNS